MKKVLLNAKTGMNSWEDVYVPVAEDVEEAVGVASLTVVDRDSPTEDEIEAIRAALADGKLNAIINGSRVVSRLIGPGYDDVVVIAKSVSTDNLEMVRIPLESPV